MTDTITAPEGYTVEKLTAKAKQADGSTKEYNYAIAKPSSVTLAGLLAAGDDIASMLAEATFNGMKQAARNMAVRDLLVNVSLAMPADLQRIGAEMAANRATNGEALVLYRELTAAIIVVAEGAGISAAGVAKIRKLVSSAAGLSLASNVLKGKVHKLIEATAGAMDDDTLERLATPIDKLLTACTETDDDDIDF